MSEQVKRYDYGYKDDGCGGDRYLGLIEKPDGALVRHSDYAALEAECDKLRAQVSALQSDANSWQSGYDKGREDGAKAADGWKAQHARDSAELRRLCAERDAVLLDIRRYGAMGLEHGLNAQIDALLSSAELVKCDTCHGQGEVWSGENQYFGYMSMQPPEPIIEVYPECGEEAPSLPAAGSVVEDGPDITTKHGYPAYSVAQHERIVAARDAAIEEWSGTAVQNGMEVDRLSAELSELRAALLNGGEA